MPVLTRKKTLRRRDDDQPAPPPPDPPKPKKTRKGLDSRLQEQLSAIYLNPEEPGSFGGVAALLKAAKAKGIQVTKDEVVQYLRGQDAYTKHAKVAKGPTLPVILSGAFDTWEADLMDITYPKKNRGYKHLLNVIDCFTKYAWSIPVKTKAPAEIAPILDKLITTEVPTKRIKLNTIRTDGGNEFKGKCNEVYKKWGIKHMNAFKGPSAPGAGFIERFNRILGHRIYSYRTKAHEYDSEHGFIDVLPALIKGYNQTPHGTTGEKPLDLHQQAKKTPEEREKNPNPDLVKVAHKIQFKRRGIDPSNIFYQERKQHQFLKPGTWVRVIKNRMPFAKSYTGQWTREVFKIKPYSKHNKLRYWLEDESGKNLGAVHRWEVQPLAEKPKIFDVDLYKRRHLKGKEPEVLVHWKGYPKKQTEWIPEKELVTGTT